MSMVIYYLINRRSDRIQEIQHAVVMASLPVNVIAVGASIEMGKAG